MGALSTGIAAGRTLGTGNAIGDVIKGILENARAQGLIQTQAAGNIALARAKGELGQTKSVFQVQGGVGTPVLDPEGNPLVVDKTARVITPREGETEGERALADMKARIKAQAMQDMLSEGGGEGNVIEQSATRGNVIEQGAAGGSAMPVSAMATQGTTAPQQAPIYSQEDEQLNQLLDQLEAQ